MSKTWTTEKLRKTVWVTATRPGKYRLCVRLDDGFTSTPMPSYRAATVAQRAIRAALVESEKGVS